MALALKKSDLYSSLWSSADELRGGMDASQYKDYVLTLLFVKYVSDKAKADPYSLIVIPEGGSFDDLVAAKGKSNVGELVNIAIHRLAEKNNLVDVLKNADFDDRTRLGDGRDLVDRVSNLIGIFQDLDFSGSRAEGDDLLGDAYEYLMRHFATESGKSKGQFYTPAEVSRVMAQLLQIPVDTPKSATVYDPTCGSGSLLIKVADASPHGLTIYGQENDVATWALARMNMILHGNETSDIRQGNTLADPKFRSGDKIDAFDYLVANPPFSVKTWKNGVENNYGRFDGFDSPPDKSGDFAFLLHMIKSLKSTGKGAVILPHGVLFRGNAEANIRRELVKRGYVKAIIGLPANLFYGTGIPACILVIDKKDAQTRTGIFMIDASKGFAKDGPKNRLRPRDMHKIVDAFSKLQEISSYARMVPVSEIADPKNNYNLNIPRYIDSSEPEDIQDLHAHLQGGIPNRDLDALQPYWNAFPTLRSKLVKPLRDGYSELAVNKSEIYSTIIGSSEYIDFAKSTDDAVTGWWAKHHDQIISIDGETKSADLIGDLSEELLAIFRSRPLIDEYGVYEQLMSYWNESMHDDVAMIMSEGWDEAVTPRMARSWKDKNNKTKYEDAHLQFGTGAKAERWVMDLVPPILIVKHFFAEDQANIDAITTDLAQISQRLDEFIEEHAVEEGLLWEAVDGEKVTAKSAKTRLKDAKTEGADADEIEALQQVVKLFEAETAHRNLVKEAQIKLDGKILKQYGRLATGDVQALVTDDKWGATLERRINQEVTTLGQILIARLRVLADRYESTVRELEAELEELSTLVTKHLADMGVLLTGRTRLPGFVDEWTPTKLGSVASMGSGGTPLSSVSKYYGGNIPWVSISDMTRGGKYIAETENTLSEEGLASSAAKLYEPDVVLYAMYASLGECSLAVGRVSSSQAILGIKTGPNLDREFLYYWLQYLKPRVKLLGQQGTQSNLNAGMVRDFDLQLPRIDEQKAIATVLEDVDDEIRVLERRLESARAIKQGMMQELLTGRTRLPVEAPVT